VGIDQVMGLGVPCSLNAPPPRPLLGRAAARPSHWRVALGHYRTTGGLILCGSTAVISDIDPFGV
jgi:hypothetical protein